mmetsp:Transcript_30122/g.82777  ORF Transcript_30122/g.82777 Transcript_30122/m.82777 type:complete len:216 (+) Transcript_30122:192-839(+)
MLRRRPPRATAALGTSSDSQVAQCISVDGAFVTLHLLTMLPVSYEAGLLLLHKHSLPFSMACTLEFFTHRLAVRFRDVFPLNLPTMVIDHAAFVSSPSLCLQALDHPNPVGLARLLNLRVMLLHLRVVPLLVEMLAFHFHVFPVILGCSEGFPEVAACLHVLLSGLLPLLLGHQPVFFLNHQVRHCLPVLQILTLARITLPLLFRCDLSQHFLTA